MSGGKPFGRSRKRPKLILFLILGCCGCTFLKPAIPVASAAEVDPQHAEMIPQEEVIVQGDGQTESLPITYSLRIFKDSDRIKLKGNMSSEEDYKTLMGLVKANFPSADLTDRIKVKDAPPDAEVKLGGLSFALKLLGYLESGQAQVDNNGVSLEGAASTAVVLTEVKKLLKNNKPTGVPLKNIRVVPPSKAWSASVTEDRTVKFSGVLPDKASKKAVSQQAQKIFANFEIDDNTVVNSNVPSKWLSAALQSLQLLAVLMRGSVEVTEDMIRLRGVAPNEMALKAIDAIASKFPSGFALKSEVTAPASRPDLAVIPTDAASMFVER